MKTFWNVLGCICAALFSILLVLIVAAFPLRGTVVSLTKPATISRVVQNVDFSDYMPSVEELQDILPIEGFSAQSIEELLNTDAAADAIGLYAADVFGAVLDRDTQRQFTADALRSIIDEKMDELVETLKPYVPADAPLSDEEIASRVRDSVDEHAETLVEALPLPEPVPAEDSEPLAWLSRLLDPAVTISMIAVLLVCAAVIYACRFKRFGGLLWLGIDALVCALPLTFFALVLNSSLITNLYPPAASLLTPIVDVFVRDLVVTVVICVIMGAALITAYTLLRRRTAKTSLPETAATE